MSVALFPGQGSLKPAMGVPWMEHPSFAVIDTIGELTGIDVRHLLTTAESAELVRTDNAQIATFALSTAIFDAALQAGCSFEVAIGHSLGEYSALVCASILSLEDGARLVVERGRAMAAAAELSEGSMAAILGVDEERVLAALTRFPDLVIANRNAPGQIVVAGPVSSLTELAADAKHLGLRKVMRLEVGGAFHSPMMAPARDRLRSVLEGIHFSLGTLPVIANIDATPHVGTDRWSDLLTAQLTGAVEFEASIRRLGQPMNYVECGPGGVLGGLVRRISPEATIVSLSTPADLEAKESTDE